MMPFWYLYCQLHKHFTPFSSVSVADFGYIFVCWEDVLLNKFFYSTHWAIIVSKSLIRIKKQCTRRSIRYIYCWLKIRLWPLSSASRVVRQVSDLVSTTNYNLGQNTCRLYYVWAQFHFTTIETELYCYHQKFNRRVASQVPERFKIKKNPWSAWNW